MVKALTFKGDKKPKKRKRTDADPDSIAASSTAPQPPPDADADAGEDDSWVSADAPSDITGPVILVLPTTPLTCLACDANGSVFASAVENAVEGDPASAEPHDVRQVWVATRVAGTEGVSLRGHHGKYVY